MKNKGISIDLNLSGRFGSEVNCRDRQQSTPCSHAILISEWQHTNGMRTVVQRLA
jgi:hypothetical protein